MQQIKLGTHDLGLTDDQATWGLSAIGAVSTVSRVLAGYLAGKYRSQEARILMGGLVLAGACLMILPSCSSFWSYLLVNAGIGFVLVWFV